MNSSPTSRDSFDVLYQEGETAPKMMSVGALPSRQLPGRANALCRFLDYIGQHERVWVPTRLQIAQHCAPIWPISAITHSISGGHRGDAKGSHVKSFAAKDDFRRRHTMMSLSPLAMDR